MSLLTDIATRGFWDGRADVSYDALRQHGEPVAIDCAAIARGWFEANLHGDDGQERLAESLAGLPTRPPFSSTWMEWVIPFDGQEVLSNPNGYRTLRDGALLTNVNGTTHAIMFCEGNPSTGGKPIMFGTLSFKDYMPVDRMVAAALTPPGVTIARAVATQSNLSDAQREQVRTMSEENLALTYMVSIGAWHVLTTALRLMHVKNVDVVDKPTRKRGKKQRRLRPDQLIQWKTLEVRPGGMSESAGSGGGESLTAHHIVRGHFATYTADKPLFGKYVGTYWREAHARGDRKAGEVAKDYRVAA